MTETGVVHGRFQVLHLKHMEYFLAAKMRCRVMYVGITHPDIGAYPATSPLDLHGTAKADNPLTYIERYEMIRDALLDFGVKRDEFEIIPFPVSRPQKLPEYVPADAVHYMSLCGEWMRKNAGFSDHSASRWRSCGRGAGRKKGLPVRSFAE